MAAHFLDGLSFGDGVAIADGFELLAEFAASDEAVHFAGAIDLALDADAGGQVFEENTVGGFVDFLAASARAADEFFQQLDIGDPEGEQALFEGGQLV